MEEKQITPEEAFFSAKANLELAITAQLKEFAVKFCTSVIFKGCVEVQPYVSETGEIVDTRIPMLKLKLSIVKDEAYNSIYCNFQR